MVMIHYVQDLGSAITAWGLPTCHFALAEGSESLPRGPGFPFEGIDFLKIEAEAVLHSKSFRSKHGARQKLLVWIAGAEVVGSFQDPQFWCESPGS